MPTGDLERTDVLPVIEAAHDDLQPGSPAAGLIHALAEEQAALERLLEASRAETAVLAMELAASALALERAEARAAAMLRAAAPIAPAAVPEIVVPAPVAIPVPAPAPVSREPALALALRAAESLNARYLEALQSGEWHRGVRDEQLRELEDKLACAERRSREFAAERAALTTAVEALIAEQDARVAALSVAPSAAPPGAAAATRPDATAPRIVELEGVAATLGRALEAQTDAAHLASSQIAAIERAAGELRARAHYLEDELAASERRGEEHMRAARSADAALTANNQHLGEALERALIAERAATAAASEHDLTVAALTARLEQQTLLLERARGALEERELQIRRLERNASRRPANADGGVEPGAAAGPALAAGRPIAMLRPIDGSEPRLLASGRRTTIGRAPENDLCIPDASVSRRHALIVIGSTGTIIEDLNSANGIAVNGRRVRHAHLSDGDIVSLGTVRFVYARAPRNLASA